MEDGRQKRRAATKKAYQAQVEISASHFVGYVEDEEGVEAIMKKFEELERFQQELQATKGKDEELTSDGDQKTPSPENERIGEGEGINMTENVLEMKITRLGQVESGEITLTEEQLEEIFRRTSSFTVKAAMFADEYDEEDEEFWENEINREQAYEDEYYGEMDDGFWDDEEFSLFNKSMLGKRKRGSHATTGDRRGRERGESALTRYRMLQVQLQDRQGNYFTVRKKIKFVDPSIPTYVKIPPLPIPRSWIHPIEPYIKETTEIPASKSIVADILKLNLTTLSKGFLAILMDPPLRTDSMGKKPGYITPQQLAKLKIPDIIPFGFLFIWVEKEFMPDIIQITQNWGFNYVENLCWIKLDVHNRVVRQSSTYFNKCKTTLLIFRKEGDVELRHQRNPDCIFDFVKPKEDSIGEEKPNFIYKIIETLLPGASLGPKNLSGGKLLELWAHSDRRRAGWVSVMQQK